MVAASNAGRIGVFGRSGSGKSAYIKKRIRGRGRVVIFDPMQEYDAGAVVRHTHRASLDEVRQHMAGAWGDFRVSYVPPGGREPAALSALCRLLMRAQTPFYENADTRGLLLVVEEMNLAFAVSGGAERCPGFAEICSRGRHYGIEVIGASQRIAEVSNRFRGNCSEMVILAQATTADVKRAAKDIDQPEDRIRALPDLNYLHREKGQVSPGKVTF